MAIGSSAAQAARLEEAVIWEAQFSVGPIPFSRQHSMQLVVATAIVSNY